MEWTQLAVLGSRQSLQLQVAIRLQSDHDWVNVPEEAGKGRLSGWSQRRRERSRNPIAVDLTLLPISAEAAAGDVLGGGNRSSFVRKIGPKTGTRPPERVRRKGGG